MLLNPMGDDAEDDDAVVVAEDDGLERAIGVVAITIGVTPALEVLAIDGEIMGSAFRRTALGAPLAAAVAESVIPMAGGRGKGMGKGNDWEEADESRVEDAAF